VKWTFDSCLPEKFAAPKTSTYRFVDRIDAPDDFTVVFYMKEPDAALLWNISDGAIGIVRSTAGVKWPATRRFGPFKFGSSETDKEVIIERNDDYWAGRPDSLACVSRLCRMRPRRRSNSAKALAT